MKQIVNQIKLTFHASDKGQILNSPSGVPQKKNHINKKGHLKLSRALQIKCHDFSMILPKL